MLSNRYANDGQPLLALNQVQIDCLHSVNAKVKSGEYRFEQVGCPVCNGNNAQVLAEKDRYGLFYPVSLCSECGLIYTSPRMDQASYAAFYDVEYRALYHGEKDPVKELFERNRQRARSIVAFLLAAGCQVDGKRVLEVGCGAGGILAWFRDQHGCEVKGCDLGSEGIRYGMNHHQLDLYVGDLNSITPDWKPDIVIYSHVFEHILDPARECALVRNRLADGGVVYIEVPGVKNIRSAYDGDFLKLLQNAHVFNFTLDTLVNVVSRHGFELVKGSEFVRSVFRKGAFRNDYRNDYGDVLSFLEKTEMLRKSRVFLLRNYLFWFARKLKVRAILRKIFKKNGAQ